MPAVHTTRLKFFCLNRCPTQLCRSTATLKTFSSFGQVASLAGVRHVLHPPCDGTDPTGPEGLNWLLDTHHSQSFRPGPLQNGKACGQSSRSLPNFAPAGVVCASFARGYLEKLHLGAELVGMLELLA